MSNVKHWRSMFEARLRAFNPNGNWHIKQDYRSKYGIHIELKFSTQAGPKPAEAYFRRADQKVWLESVSLPLDVCPSEGMRICTYFSSVFPRKRTTTHRHKAGQKTNDSGVFIERQHVSFEARMIKLVKSFDCIATFEWEYCDTVKVQVFWSNGPWLSCCEGWRDISCRYEEGKLIDLTYTQPKGKAEWGLRRIDGGFIVGPDGEPALNTEVEDFFIENLIYTDKVVPRKGGAPRHPIPLEDDTLMNQED